jgi:HNH endonuclease/AP2 domain
MKTIKTLPSQEELHRLFEYRKGNLYRKIKPRNSAKIGDKAGYLNAKGYIILTLNNFKYYMHRIIWCYHFGLILNQLQIDHIDGNKANNMIENLRLATNSQNGSNKKRAHCNSKSNILGVSWSKARNKWKAQIKKNNKDFHLGYFLNQEDAIAARKAAELQYFAEFAP